MRKAAQRFKYVDLVNLGIGIPENLDSAIVDCTSKIERARTVCEWVVSTIADDETTVDTEQVLSCKKGTCLGKSALAVSLLRNLGFSKEEVFVIILVKKGENPFEALHALVYLQSEEIFFDLTDGFCEYDKTLEDVSFTSMVVLMFNDEICLVPY